MVHYRTVILVVKTTVTDLGDLFLAEYQCDAPSIR